MNKLLKMFLMGVLVASVIAAVYGLFFLAVALVVKLFCTMFGVAYNGFIAFGIWAFLTLVGCLSGD